MLGSRIWAANWHMGTWAGRRECIGGHAQKHEHTMLSYGSGSQVAVEEGMQISEACFQFPTHHHKDWCFNPSPPGYASQGVISQGRGKQTPQGGAWQPFKYPRACVNSLSSGIFWPIIMLCWFIHVVNYQKVKGTQRFEVLTFSELPWSFFEKTNTLEVESQKRERRISQCFNVVGLWDSRKLCYSPQMLCLCSIF